MGLEKKDEKIVKALGEFTIVVNLIFTLSDLGIISKADAAEILGFSPYESYVDQQSDGAPGPLVEIE